MSKPLICAQGRRCQARWGVERQRSSLAVVLSLGAIDHLANHRCERAPGALRIAGDEGFVESLELVPLDQIDGGATEATAGQPSAKTGRMRAGQFHQQVQLEATVLEKIARAFVALEKVLSEL